MQSKKYRSPTPDPRPPAPRGVEQIAPVYDGFCGPLNRLVLGRWRREIAESLSGDVLEVGVGTGLNLSYYGPAARVIGIEPERALIQTAHPRAARRGFLLQVADAQSLPFRDASFDAVVSTLVFCTIPDPAQALREIRRVLRPHGRLLQLEHTRTNRPRIDRILDHFAPKWHTISGGCNINRDIAALLAHEGWHTTRHNRHLGGLIRVLVSQPS